MVALKMIITSLLMLFFTTAVEATCRSYNALCLPWLDSFTCTFIPGCGYDETLGCHGTEACDYSQEDCDLSMSCIWDEPGVCSLYDYVTCSDANSDFMQCYNTDHTQALEDLLATTSLEDYSQALSDYTANFACSCMTEYFKCLFAGDCAEEDGLQTTCQTMVDAFSLVGSCPPTACADIGATAEDSIFHADFTFGTDITWDQATTDSFLEALNAENMFLDISWVTFDPEAGTMDVVIPEGTILTPSELDSIKTALEGLDTAIIMEAFGVEGVTVEGEAAAVISVEEYNNMSSGTILSASAAIVAAITIFVI